MSWALRARGGQGSSVVAGLYRSQGKDTQEFMDEGAMGPGCGAQPGTGHPQTSPADRPAEVHPVAQIEFRVRHPGKQDGKRPLTSQVPVSCHL